MATGHLRKRNHKNGSVSYQITAEGERDPLTGKRERRYKTVNGTKREAQAELRKMIADLESGNISTPSAIKLATWMETWLNTYLPHIEQTTRVGYEEKISNYIIPALGHIPLKALKNNDIQLWANDLSKRGLSPKTIRNTYNNLNAALKKAVVLRMIPYNPCEGTVLPRLVKYQAQVYNVADIQKALAAADSVSMYMIILLGATMGLRRGEIDALMWEDVDFSTNKVTIDKNRVHADKKVVQKAPKSQAGIRTLTVGSDVMAALREAKIYYDEAVANTPGFQDLGYVLCKENGEPFHPDSVTQKWRRFVQKHNLSKIRLHDLRHSYATTLIAAGVHAKVVQQRLGHSDVSITLNTYTHVLPSMDEDAAEKLDQALFSSAHSLTHLPTI